MRVLRQLLPALIQSLLLNVWRRFLLLLRHGRHGGAVSVSRLLAWQLIRPKSGVDLPDLLDGADDLRVRI